MKIDLKSILKNILSLCIVIGILFFFYKEFEANWSKIQSFRFEFILPYILLSLFAMVFTYILITYGWFLTINSLSIHKKITFIDSIAVVNTSSLGKYLPGKVWSVAIQMYLFRTIGLSKSLVLYVNMINILISTMMSTFIGFVYITLFSGIMPLVPSIFILLLFLLFGSCAIIFSSKIFKYLTVSANRIFKKEIKYFNVSERLLLLLCLIHFFSIASLGIGAYFLYLGIGFNFELSKVFSIIAAAIISDVVGFLAFIIPAGLGIREGVMYLLLNGVSIKAVSLVLPIATRIMNMFVDALLGITSFILLAHRAKERRKSAGRSG